MPTPQVLREQRAEKVEKLEKLNAKEEMTGEDRKAADELMAAIKVLIEDIERAEFTENQRSLVDKVQDRAAPPDQPGKPDTATANPGNEMRILPQFEADYKREKPGQKLYLPARVRPRQKLRAFPDTEEGMQEAYLFTRWLIAAMDKPVPASAASRAICKDMGLEFNYIEERAQSEGISTAGGYLVPDQFENTIIRLVETYGIARQECQLVPMTSDTYNQPRSTGRATVTFTGEAEDATETTLTFDRIRMAAQKLAALVKISSELNEDAAISVADLIVDEIALGFATKEDNCLFNGTGISTFGGITGVRIKMVDGNHDASRIEMTAGIDTFIEITDAFLIQAMGATLHRPASNEKWYGSKAGVHACFYRLLRAAGGNTMGELAGGIPVSYMAAPIVISQAMPTVLTAVDAIISLIYGDLRTAVTFGDRRGITIKVLMELYALSDQIGIIADERFDINVHDIGDGSTTGPLIGLLNNTT